MIEWLISWLKRLVNQKDHLAEVNKRFLERQEDVAKGVRACEALQRVLQKLKVIDSRTYILVPDWGNYERCVNKVLERDLHKITTNILSR